MRLICTAPILTKFPRLALSSDAITAPWFGAGYRPLGPMSAFCSWNYALSDARKRAGRLPYRTLVEIVCSQMLKFLHDVFVRWQMKGIGTWSQFMRLKSHALLCTAGDMQLPDAKTVE